MAQLRASRGSEAEQHASRLGMGTAATLAAADLVYVGNGTLSKKYLLDAAAQLLWITVRYRHQRAERAERAK